MKEVPRYEIAIADLRGSSPEGREAQLVAERERMSHQLFSAEQWPLFDIRLSRLSDERTRLHLSLDLCSSTAAA